MDNLIMKRDRSNWTVRKVSLAEAEALDDEFYGSLSAAERLEMLMDLRSMTVSNSDKRAPWLESGIFIKKLKARNKKK